jgi:hypothetical protein
VFAFEVFAAERTKTGKNNKQMKVGERGTMVRVLMGGKEDKPSI